MTEPVGPKVRGCIGRPMSLWKKDASPVEESRDSEE